jgi:hypothetical protein
MRRRWSLRSPVSRIALLMDRPQAFATVTLVMGAVDTPLCGFTNGSPIVSRIELVTRNACRCTAPTCFDSDKLTICNWPRSGHMPKSSPVSVLKVTSETMLVTFGVWSDILRRILANVGVLSPGSSNTLPTIAAPPSLNPSTASYAMDGQYQQATSNHNCSMGHTETCR